MRRSMRKRSRKPSSVRRYYRKRRSPSKGGMLRLVRWSNRDSTNLCHFIINGTAGGSSVPLTTTFQFGDIAGAGELTSLFDNYMITKVLYRWVLRRDPSQGLTAGAFPRVLWVHDFNDQLAPATVGQLRQYSNCREYNFTEERNQSKWYTLKAASLPLTYVSSVTTATGPKWNQWFDTSLTTVPHYGLKYAVDQLYTNISVLLEAKIVMTLKGVS